MPNLDELSHDMEFTIGGEKFIVHDVSPDVLMTMERDMNDEGEESQEVSAMVRVDEQITAFLNGDKEQVERYKAMRARTDPAVPLWKILEFRRLLWETQSDRPTSEPSGSASGRGKTVRTSGAA